MPLYEHVFLARQDISQAQVEALTKEYTTVIEEGGGKVGKTEYWGVKTIAFKIKKNRKAHYSLLNIDAPPAAVAEMERRMGLSTDVIRFITVRVDVHQREMRLAVLLDAKGEALEPPIFGLADGPALTFDDRAEFLHQAFDLLRGDVLACQEHMLIKRHGLPFLRFGPGA